MWKDGSSKEVAYALNTLKAGVNTFSLLFCEQTKLITIALPGGTLRPPRYLSSLPCPEPASPVIPIWLHVLCKILLPGVPLPACHQMILWLPLEDCIVAYSWNKVSELINFAWYLKICSLWILTLVGYVWLFYFAQGPPGTGKSFVGVAIVHLLLSMNVPQNHGPILVRCRVPVCTKMFCRYSKNQIVLTGMKSL